MSDRPSIGHWSVSEADLVGLDAAKARNLIVRCFFEAQKETVARAQESLGMGHDDAAVHRAVEDAVRLAFTSSGFSFDRPTKPALQAVVELLARRSSAFGTPTDIIAHHKEQIELVLGRLAG